MKLGEDCIYTFSSSLFTNSFGVRGSAVGSGTALQDGRSHWDISSTFRLNPSGRTVALGSTHPLTEMSMCEGGRCVGPTTLLTSYANCPESLESLNLLEPYEASNGIAVNTTSKMRCDTLYNLSSLRH